MLLKARELRFFLLFIVMLVFCSFYKRTSDITKTIKYRRESEYGGLVVINISIISQILQSLIVCSECETMKEPKVYLKNEANANVYTNMTDLRFQYNLSFDIEKSGIRLCPLIAPDLGPVEDDIAIWSLTGVQDMNLRINPGGIHIPTECLAVEQVAIIVPIHETSRFQYNFSGIEKTLRPCHLAALGPVTDGKTIWRLFSIDYIYLRIEPGGIHIPANCLAAQQVAIVIPIHETRRIISNYIGGFLYYIHPFLMKQQLEYQIFVICKPNATEPYKRGELFNIGFKVALTYRPMGWDCVIFHDAHLVPLDTRNLYRCTNNPRKLITNFKEPYKFGGVVALRPLQFIKANGFSNGIWSNDEDYIDMYKRLIAANLTVETNVTPFGNYSYYEVLRQENHKLQQNQKKRPHYLKDGVSTVSCDIKNCMKMKKFYTLITVTK